MSDKLEALNLSYVQRNAPASGPTSSAAWNATMEELAVDLARLSGLWDRLYTLVDSLPYGNKDILVDAFQYGIDGKHVWVDSRATSTSTELTFYDLVKDRPITVYEALKALYIYIDGQVDTVVDTIVDQATGLTTDQKNRIGANIFDNTQSSSSTSLDGKSERNRLNVIQLAKDVYGPSYGLNNDGSAFLTNSVYAMVDALLELHNGNWDDDITLDHTGSFSATQTDINSSAPGDDTFTGSPADLSEDLDQIRTQIKALKGTTGWLTSLSSLYTGGANSLEKLLVNTYGSGTKTSQNPWGYQYDDIDGMTNILDAIKTFLGQSSYTDNNPIYLSTTFITNGQALETSIGKLDSALATISGTQHNHLTQLSGLRLFVGQDSISDSTPTYSSTVHIANGDSLETAIGKLDSTVTAVSGLAGASTFLDLSDTPSTFSGQALKVLRVNSGETAIEFLAFSHSNLSNLSVDDHPQYFLANGSRAMAGTLNMGGQDITYIQHAVASGNVTASGDVYASGYIHAQRDIEVFDNAYGVIIRSPSGIRYRITVDDAGTLGTTAV